MAFASVAERDKGWLAGMFDGEGCVSVYRPAKQPSCVQVKMALNNSDWRTVKRCSDLINRLTGIRVPVNYRKARTGSGPGWQIELCQKVAICKLLDCILKDLTTIKAPAAHLYELCRYRGDHGPGSVKPDWIYRFHDKIRFFNSHYLEPNGTWRAGHKGQYKRTSQFRRTPSSEGSARDCTGRCENAEGTVHGS